MFALRAKRGKDEVIEIRDLQTAEVKATLGKGLGLARGSLAYSPDGKWIAAEIDLSGLFKHAVVLLDAESGKRIATLGSPFGPSGAAALAFSADGTKLAVLNVNFDKGLQHEMRVWDLKGLPK